jgi:hypothetical protein
MAGGYDMFLACSRRLLAALLPDDYLIARWVDMAAVACLYTALVLVFFRFAGFPARVRGARREMVAHACGIFLYRRSPGMVARLEARLAWANLKLLFFLLPTLLFGGALFAGAFETLADRSATPALPPGAEFVVRVRPAVDRAVELADLDVRADPSDMLLTGRVRSFTRRTVWTRLRAVRSGVIPLSPGPHGIGRVTVNIASAAAPVRRWQYADGLEVCVNYARPHERSAEYGWLAWFFLFCSVGSVPAAQLLRVRL